MSRPKGVVETEPRQKRIGESRPDSAAYRYSDSGCSLATEFIQEQSLCFECPFTSCKMEGVSDGT